MSNQINYVEKLEKRNKIKYKNDLIKKGKRICNGSLCKGLIKSNDEFSKSLHKNRCNNCELFMSKKKYTKNKKKYQVEKIKLKENKKCDLCGIKNIEIIDFYKLNSEKKELKSLTHYFKTILICKWCLKILEKQLVEKINKKVYYSLDDEKEKLNLKSCEPCNGQLCKGRLRNKNRFKTNKKNCIKCSKYKNIIQNYLTKVF